MKNFAQRLKSSSMVSIFMADFLQRFQSHWVKLIARDDRIAVENAYERRIDAVEIDACDFAFTFTQAKTSEQSEDLKDSLPSRYRNNTR